MKSFYCQQIVKRTVQSNGNKVELFLMCHSCAATCPWWTSELFLFVYSLFLSSIGSTIYQSTPAELCHVNCNIWLKPQRKRTQTSATKLVLSWVPSFPCTIWGTWSEQVYWWHKYKPLRNLRCSFWGDSFQSSSKIYYLTDCFDFLIFTLVFIPFSSSGTTFVLYFFS